MANRIFLFLLVAAAACTNNQENTSSKDKAGKNTDSATIKTFTWTQEEEGEFLSGCVDSAKIKLGEAAAFARCKCILGQLKQSFPNMDSAAPALMDVNRVSEMAAKCK